MSHLGSFHLPPHLTTFDKKLGLPLWSVAYIIFTLFPFHHHKKKSAPWDTLLSSLAFVGLLLCALLVVVAGELELCETSLN